MGLEEELSALVRIKEEQYITFNGVVIPMNNSNVSDIYILVTKNCGCTRAFTNIESAIDYVQKHKSTKYRIRQIKLYSC
jgi:hypothetical protein